MNAFSLMLKHIRNGWAVTLSDGRELVRFTGFGAKRRALRYVAHHYFGPEARNVF
jgi:hypothetical protein